MYCCGWNWLLLAKDTRSFYSLQHGIIPHDSHCPWACSQCNTLCMHGVPTVQFVYLDHCSNCITTDTAIVLNSCCPCCNVLYVFVVVNVVICFVPLLLSMLQCALCLCCCCPCCNVFCVFVAVHAVMCFVPLLLSMLEFVLYQCCCPCWNLFCTNVVVHVGICFVPMLLSMLEFVLYQCCCPCWNLFCTDVAVHVEICFVPMLLSMLKFVLCQCCNFAFVSMLISML